jgi:hypothetical protein
MNVTVLGTNFWQYRGAVEKLGDAAFAKSDMTAWFQLTSTLARDNLPNRSPLVDMLDQTFLLKSSWIHDRLYAIMQLADDFQENDIEVDYNKTASQVMLDSADHHIRQHRNLRFLCGSFRSYWQETSHQKDFPTWVPLRWLGSDPRGTAILSFQKDHEIAVGEQPDDDEGSSCKNFSYGKYAHNKRSGKFLTRFPDQELFTTCTPDSIDMTHMRLCVRGMKVGEIRTVLSMPLVGDNGNGMTVKTFWSSGVGQHIRSYFRSEGRQIPLGMVRALVDPWPNEDFNHEDAVSGLMWFYDHSTKPDLADHHIGYSGHLIDTLLGPPPDYVNGDAAAAAISNILSELNNRKGILTDKDQFGLVPHCNIRAGDEIWMLLGHFIPSVLRKRPSGTYEHICTGSIPVLMDDIVGHTDIRRFSTRAAPGEQIGEWTIEDIELV